MPPKTPGPPGSAADRLRATYQYLLGKKTPAHRTGVRLNRDVRDALVSQEARQEVVSVLQAAANLGLFPARLSEASIQIQDNIYLVTKRDSWFNKLAGQDLILSLPSTDGLADENQLPNHWNWHLEIFRGNSNIKAVVLGLPAALMALTSKKELPQDEMFSEGAELIGGIKLCQATVSSIHQGAEQARLLVVPGIGALSQGESISEAVMALEMANHWSEITLLASR